MLREIKSFGFEKNLKLKLVHQILILEKPWKIITDCLSSFVNSQKSIKLLHLNWSELWSPHPAAVLNHLVKGRSHLHPWIWAISCNTNTHTHSLYDDTIKQIYRFTVSRGLVIIIDCVSDSAK